MTPATEWMISTIRPPTHTLYVGAAEDARLTVARAATNGKLTLITQASTHEGDRNGVVTKTGVVYLAHAQLGELAWVIVVSPSKN